MTSPAICWCEVITVSDHICLAERCHPEGKEGRAAMMAAPTGGACRRRQIAWMTSHVEGSR